MTDDFTAGLEHGIQAGEERIRDRIAELTERIHQTTPRVRPPIWYPATGPDVEYLQQRLAAHGFYSIEHGDPPGVFDRSTETAVRAFQVSRGMRADAFCDQAVWVALDEPPRESGARS